MDNYEKPEMLRVPLDALCLRISLMNLGHPAKFLDKALTPPEESAVRSSLQQLVDLSAMEFPRQLDEDGEMTESGWRKEDQKRLLKAKLRLTPLGTYLAQLPVDASVGKLLVLGCLFGIPQEVCTLAAALSSKSPFSASTQKQDDMDKKRLKLAGRLESDQLMLVSLFERWEHLGKRSASARSWCRTNGLDIQTFENVSEMRAHLLGVLAEQGFISREEAFTKLEGRKTWSWMPPCLASVSTAAEEFERRKRQLLRSLLCGALWPNVVLKKPDGSMFARNQGHLMFHPSSILSLQEKEANESQAGDWTCKQCSFFNFGTRTECLTCSSAKPPPGERKAPALRHQAFMFGEKMLQLGQPGQKSKLYVRNCSGVQLKALLLLGHNVGVDFLTGRLSVDGWIHAQSAPRDAAMLLGLRRLLQDLFKRRLSCMSSGSMTKEDREILNVVASVLALDAD